MFQRNSRCGIISSTRSSGLLRLGSWNWLDSRCVERIRKRNTFLSATLVILLLPFNELCVHVPKEFSMWNNIERSQLRLGSWNWLDSRWIEKIRVQSFFSPDVKFFFHIARNFNYENVEIRKKESNFEHWLLPQSPKPNLLCATGRTNKFSWILNCLGVFHGGIRTRDPEQK